MDEAAKNDNGITNLHMFMLRFKNENGTNKCFSNTAVSALLNIPVLRSAIRSFKIENLGNNSICGELFRLANLRNYTIASTDKIRAIVRDKCFENRQWIKNFSNNKQHDSGEFLQSLLEHFWNEPIMENSLRDEVFGGLSQNILSCKCGREEELQVQHMPEVIPLQIKGKSVQSCLNDFLAAEDIEWNCPSCSSSRVLRRIAIIIEPKIIILQLMRYKYDEARQRINKITDEVDCSDKLILPSESTYSLLSVINHIGEYTRSGHYNIVLFGDQLTLLDDDVISNYNIKEDMNRLSYIFIYEKD
jgi:uncharacterized UBP type Zn finger protein